MNDTQDFLQRLRNLAEAFKAAGGNTALPDLVILEVDRFIGREHSNAQTHYEVLLEEKERWFKEAGKDDIARMDMEDSALADSLEELRHFLPPACHWVPNIASSRLRYYNKVWQIIDKAADEIGTIDFELV